jgi:hypothetical protein
VLFGFSWFYLFRFYLVVAKTSSSFRYSLGPNRYLRPEGDTQKLKGGKSNVAKQEQDQKGKKKRNEKAEG